MSSNLAWLKSQCEYLSSGRGCGNRACMERGGWDINKAQRVDWRTATCEIREITIALETAIELAKSVVGGRCSEHPQVLAERILSNAVADRLSPSKNLDYIFSPTS